MQASTDHTLPTAYPGHLLKAELLVKMLTSLSTRWPDATGSEDIVDESRGRGRPEKCSGLPVTKEPAAICNNLSATTCVPPGMIRQMIIHLSGNNAAATTPPAPPTSAWCRRTEQQIMHNSCLAADLLTTQQCSTLTKILKSCTVQPPPAIMQCTAGNAGQCCSRPAPPTSNLNLQSNLRAAYHS
jgi:hypothetical protein